MKEKLRPAFEKNNIAIAFAANDAFVPYMAAGCIFSLEIKKDFWMTRRQDRNGREE